MKRVNYIFSMSFILSSLLISLSSYGTIFKTAATSPVQLTGKKYMVAADHEQASQAGARILAQGGNAIDAAVATGFALGVARPYSGGLGGGGFMLIAPHNQEPLVLDFRAISPRSIAQKDYVDQKGNCIPDKTYSGPWSVAVPGNLRGLVHALHTYGTKTLEEIIQPAIELAQQGILVDKHTHEAMKTLIRRINNQYETYKEISRIFLKKLPNSQSEYHTQPYAIGEILKQPDLAITLQRIALEGETLFYEGELADKLIASIAEGPLTKEDLTSYTLKQRTPLKGSYRDYTIYTMPPPSSGGACILQVLHVMNRYSKKSPKGLFYTRLAESMKNAFADRAQYLGDADVYPEVYNDLKKMLSPVYSQLIYNRIEKRNAQTIHSDTYGFGQFVDIKQDFGTTHVSVIDAQGNTVSFTDTINHHFGSLIVIPGTGIPLNNEMDDFSVRSDTPNKFGLLMSERNVIAPSQRPLSSMSPTILINNQGERIVIGGSGGPFIISGILHTLINLIEFNNLPHEAIIAPRFHHQWHPDVLYCEPSMPSEFVKMLKQKGHHVVPYEGTTSAVSPGIVQVVMKKNNTLYGASDPRKGGKPAGI